jgi:triphosphoribosyl-dephospho-CoA synthase
MAKIAQLAQKACILEVCAPKPGNVNRRRDFPDASFEDFLLSAIAIGPAFENAVQWGVGKIIYQAVMDTRCLVRSNTNLGMILLLAPLAKAAGNGDLKNIRKNLSAILKSLTVEDARLAYEAIRLAQPGGMGKVADADVSGDPSITLFEAMALARERDSIAREYVTDYAISFEIGLPALMEALSQGMDYSRAIVHAFLTILSATPDTLISRKRGLAAARGVSQRAKEVLSAGDVFTGRGRDAISELDRELRDPGHTLNPGATADLTAAAVFINLLQSPENGPGKEIG